MVADLILLMLIQLYYTMYKNTEYWIGINTNFVFTFCEDRLEPY